MEFDNAAIVEIELEKMRNDRQPEAVRTVRRSKFKFRWILLFFAGMMILKIIGDVLSLI